MLASRALIVGCGALGSVVANTLCRAGVGHLRIVDRDFVEITNLQRQVLYDEDDVAAGLPKAVAAQRKLKRINSEIEIEAIVADVSHENIESLLAGVDVLVDGLDNFETRFLLNEASVKFGVPWVYGGCVGAEGQTMTVLPGESACLRCVLGEPPPPGSAATCDTIGVLGPIVNVVASLEAMEAIKLLTGRRDTVNTKLMIYDVWANRTQTISTAGLREASQCPTCVGHQYPFLHGQAVSHTAVLCGRNAVQLSFPDRQSLDLDSLARQWRTLGDVTRNPFLLRGKFDKYELTVFPDGRAIIGGTDDVTTARSVYAQYVGN
jgi:molybdopterin/thiamine biosynthesis adenylyltransferase